MLVKLKAAHPEYIDLSEDQPYFVIGIEADDYRILNDAGRPYLYPSNIFQIVDSLYPLDWVIEFGEDGEQYAYPAPLNEGGFFEGFFDHRQKQISIFWQVVNRNLSKAA
jgi:hypothetical protein